MYAPPAGMVPTSYGSAFPPEPSYAPQVRPPFPSPSSLEEVRWREREGEGEGGSPALRNPSARDCTMAFLTSRRPHFGNVLLCNGGLILGRLRYRMLESLHSPSVGGSSVAYWHARMKIGRDGLRNTPDCVLKGDRLMTALAVLMD